MRLHIEDISKKQIMVIEQPKKEIKPKVKKKNAVVGFVIGCFRFVFNFIGGVFNFIQDCFFNIPLGYYMQHFIFAAIFSVILWHLLDVSHESWKWKVYIIGNMYLYPYARSIFTPAIFFSRFKQADGVMVTVTRKEYDRIMLWVDFVPYFGAFVIAPFAMIGFGFSGLVNRLAAMPYRY